MRESDFSSASLGRLVRLSPSSPVRGFVPAPIPRGILLKPDIVKMIGDVRDSLGALRVGVANLPQPDLLVRPFQKNEAVLSSRIEGTQTTIEEAIVAQAARYVEVHDADAVAVRNYDTALQLGIAEIKAGRPITLALLCGIQAELVKDDPKQRDTAGQFRTRQVLIGPDACAQDPTLARFVPPPREFLQDCLDDLNRYLTEPPEDEALVRIALTHYQFEAAHPFADGNGRAGRVLIALQMTSEGLMEQPWLYPSPEIERRREEYVAALYAVSANGDVDRWLRFFLDVVRVSARSTRTKLDRLGALHEDFKRRLHHYKSPLPTRVLPELFHIPAIRIGDVAGHLKCDTGTARNTVRELVRRGVLTKWEGPLGRSSKRGRPAAFYLCREIFEIISAP